MRFTAYLLLWFLLIGQWAGSTFAQGWVTILDSSLVVFEITEGRSGNYFFSGYDKSEGNSSYLGSVDQQGNFEWKANLRSNSGAISVYQPDIDKVFVLTRRRDGAMDTDNLVVYKIDLTTQLITSVDLGDFRQTPGVDYKIKPLDTGGFVIGGVRNTPNGYSELMVFDDSGDLLNQLAFDHFSLIYDTHFVTAGEILLFVKLSNYEDALARIDFAGNILAVDTLELDFQGKTQLFSIREEVTFAYVYEDFGGQFIQLPSQGQELEYGPTSLNFRQTNLSVLTHPESALVGLSGPVNTNTNIEPEALPSEVVISLFAWRDNQLSFQRNLRTQLPGFENFPVFLEKARMLADSNFLITGAIQLEEEFDVRYFIARLDENAQIYNQQVRGRVLSNFSNCQTEGEFTNLRGHKIVVDNLNTGIQSVYNSQEDGTYYFIADTVDYKLQQIPSNNYWQACEPILNIRPQTNDTLVIEHQYRPETFCPFLEVDIGTAAVQPCDTSRYFVSYCNSGTVPAADAYLDISLSPDMELLPNAPEYTDLGGNGYRFDVGQIPSETCHDFNFDVFIDCDTEIGATHCVQAHIYPDSLCAPYGEWSGASIDVRGNCQQDSIIFIISNTGTGTMSEPQSYIVIEDVVIRFGGTYDLPPGDSLVIKVPANGSTWRIETIQEPFHPGDSQPSITIEGCGLDNTGNFSVGFVSQFAEDDGDPFVSIDCFNGDQNSKMGFPLGYGPDHLINPEQSLEYILFFENNGLDTLNQLIIYDTLSPFLDFVSVRPGASSHPYQFSQTGEGWLQWQFDNLQISPNTEAESSGFVKFKVNTLSDLPRGTIIENQAWSIYNNSEPVSSSLTYHQVDTNFIARPTLFIQPPLLLIPNPALLYQDIYVENGWDETILVRTAMGQLVQETTLSNGYFKPNATILASGVYWIEIISNEGERSVGKLVLLR